MATIDVKYCSYANALPPQPIRMANVTWGGLPEKMKDGSDPQPWHCLPFVEGSTYGLELIYPHETECQVVHAGGTIHFEFDYTREPSGVLTGSEFGVFSPVDAGKYYLFNTRLDVQCPPGYVLRSEPHPRYFTDETGTVPLALIGHLQNEWYARLLFVVFRAPRPGERHIFRKGEPFAQILFVPQRLNYEITAMTPEEAAQRRKLEQAVGSMRSEISENRWTNADGGKQDNHYKVLVRAFAREGMAGIEKELREAGERHEQAIANCKTIAEMLALGTRLIEDRKLEQAVDVYGRVLGQNPKCAEALSNLGRCYAIGPLLAKGLEMMKEAIMLEPRVPTYRGTLGDVLRRMGRLPDAETLYRSALQLGPHDPNTLLGLGLTLARQGRTAEAFEAYRAAAAQGLPLVKAHVDMGVVFAEQNAHPEARACFEAALAIDPNSRAAKRRLQELPKV